MKGFWNNIHQSQKNEKINNFIKITGAGIPKGLYTEHTNYGHITIACETGIQSIWN